MATTVLVLLLLQGETTPLDAFRAEALVDHPDGWCMPHGNVGHALYDGANAIWVSKSPRAASLAFYARWNPPIAALDALGALAQRHGVTVLRSAAMEEGYRRVGRTMVPTYDRLWSGQGLALARVSRPTLLDARLFATCGFLITPDLARDAEAQAQDEAA